MTTQKCSVQGCRQTAITRGWCQSHYRRWMKYGRLDRVYHANQNVKCSHGGCDDQATRKGFCRSHYREVAKQNPVTARNHKQYSLWHDRKARGLLCAEWLDFFTFIHAIGERPSARHALVRKRSGLYGPDNFQWREHLKRKEGESKKEWHARKWRARRLANPTWDRPRDLLRRYGITLEQYDAMLNEQNGVCAICLDQETRADFQTGNICSLAVDHCHKTKKVRGLLCSRCNKTIGAVADSIELLHAMASYLQRHFDNNKPEPTT